MKRWAFLIIAISIVIAAIFAMSRAGDLGVSGHTQTDSPSYGESSSPSPLSINVDHEQAARSDAPSNSESTSGTSKPGNVPWHEDPELLSSVRELYPEIVANALQAQAQWRLENSELSKVIQREAVDDITSNPTIGWVAEVDYSSLDTLPPDWAVQASNILSQLQSGNEFFGEDPFRESPYPDRLDTALKESAFTLRPEVVLKSLGFDPAQVPNDRAILVLDAWRSSLISASKTMAERTLYQDCILSAIGRS